MELNKYRIVLVNLTNPAEGQTPLGEIDETQLGNLLSYIKAGVKKMGRPKAPEKILVVKESLYSDLPVGTAITVGAAAKFLKVGKIFLNELLRLKVAENKDSTTGWTLVVRSATLWFPPAETRDALLKEGAIRR